MADRLAQCLRLIRDAWGSGSLAEGVFLRLVAQLRPGRTAYLPAKHLYTIATVDGRYPPTPEVIDAVEWFTASQCTLFEQRFELFMPNGEEFVLAEDQLAEVLEHRTFIHPRTGAELPVDARLLFPYFVANPAMEAVLREVHAPAERA